MKDIKVIFDNRSLNWDENPMFNSWFLNERFIFFESRFKHQGYLTIGDVISDIGILLDTTDLKKKDMYRYGWIFPKDIFKISYEENPSKIILVLTVRDLWSEEVWEDELCQ